MEKVERALEKANDVIYQMELFMEKKGFGVADDEDLSTAYLDYLKTAREISAE